MYQYTDFDTQFVKLRAAQHRDQLERWQAGQLSDDEFRPLRLQNGWYVQRYAPMLRVAVPYGELSSAQVRVLAKIAREYDRPDAALLAEAQATQDRISDFPAPRLKSGYGHFSTRQNVQFNWIPLDQSADVMDLLASVNLHGIQTSGNCIRNITSDERAGIAVDEIADPRPFAEIIRQWSTLHPEFAFLPRKFKIAVSGAREDRAAIAWHDIGLQIVKNERGEIGFTVLVYIFLVGPLIIVLGASVSDTTYLTFPPQGLSLRWFHNIFEILVFSGSVFFNHFLYDFKESRKRLDFIFVFRERDS